MYVPKHFNIADESALEVIDANPFGLLITIINQEPMITHMPFLRHGQRLIGHLANSNPHSKHLNKDATVVFSGPHAYISPRWYVADANVPTWNYEAVEVRGSCRLIEDMDACARILDELVEQYESGEWTIDWHNRYYTNLLEHISFFELEIQTISGKRKMSQNKSVTDRQGVVAGLTATGSALDAQVAAIVGGQG